MVRTLICGEEARFKGCRSSKAGVKDVACPMRRELRLMLLIIVDVVVAVPLLQ